MDIEKTCLLMRESVYWLNMNDGTGQTARQYSTCLEYQCIQLHEAASNYDIPCKSLEVVCANIFMFNSKSPVCIVIIPSCKNGVFLSVQDLVQAVKITFTEVRLLRINSDARTNFTLETFKECCRKLNIQQSIPSSFHHQSNSHQMHQIYKMHNQKCTDNKRDPNLALLYIWSTPVEAGFLSLPVMLFNRLIWGLLPQIIMTPINIHMMMHDIRP